MKRTRIVLADDHEMLLEGLEALLQVEPGLTVVAKFVEGESLIHYLKNKGLPDLLILDINMPGLDGIDITRKLKQDYPELKILILTMYNRPEFVRKLMEVGADGYILKNSGKDILMRAISMVIEGEPYFSKEIMREMAGSLNSSPQVVTNPNLTKREKQVVELIAEGLSIQDIGEKLEISANTVSSHRKNILDKIGGHNLVDIVRYGIQSGIVKDFEL